MNGVDYMALGKALRDCGLSAPDGYAVSPGRARSLWPGLAAFRFQGKERPGLIGLGIGKECSRVLLITRVRELLWACGHMWCNVCLGWWSRA